MKTEKEVMAMLESNSNSWVAVHTADINGHNETYSSGEAGEILESLDDMDYEFDGVVPADTESVDIDVWAQDFDESIKDGLREDLENGDLYIARFTSEEYGDMELLIWK